MGTQSGTAIFDDGTTKFFVFNDLTNEAFCRLYDEEIEAQNVSRANKHTCDIPSCISSDKTESVTLFFASGDISRKSICIRTYTNTRRTYITGVSSVEYYQGKDFPDSFLDGFVAKLC